MKPIHFCLDINLSSLLWCRGVGSDGDMVEIDCFSIGRLSDIKLHIYLVRSECELLS